MLITGIPIYHAEVTAIMDACGRINSKALLGSDHIRHILAHPPAGADKQELSNWNALLRLLSSNKEA